MKIYIIKRKGANSFGNFCAFYNREKYGADTIFTGTFFHRLKDAKLCLKHSTNYPEFFEIVTLQLPKTNQDNRFNNGLKK